MRAIIQRVSSASVSVDGAVVAAIGKGMLVLLGVAGNDTTDDAEWLCGKIAKLRIFSDEQGLMNLDLEGIDGAILLVSQFTLLASYKKGNRPSFIGAARPELAIPLYEKAAQLLTTLTGRPVKTGIFGADMQVELVNDGPVTIIMDTHNRE